MAPVFALLVITLVSLLIIRIATMALVMTGLGQEAASFQAMSAFFGVGFTTKEAELVVDHPARRRIIRDLIVIGNIGLTSAVATIIVTLVRSEADWRTWLIKLAVLLAVAAAFFLVWRLQLVRRGVDHLIRLSLSRIGAVHPTDYETLLRVRSGYAVSEFDVAARSPLAARTLGELQLRRHGVVVLGIVRSDRSYVGSPNGDTRIQGGDTLVVYGTDAAVRRAAEEGSAPSE